MAEQNPITTMLVAPMLDTIMGAMYPAFDARFMVSNTASDWGELAQRLQTKPVEVVIIEADIAPDPNALQQFLDTVNAQLQVFIVLPPAWQRAKPALEQLEVVREVFIGPVNYRIVADRVATAVQSRRAAHQDIGLHESGAFRVGHATVVGTRVIALIGKGGAGKSSIASNLGQQLALSGLRTLLIDLDVPGALPSYLNVSPGKNVFFSSPDLQGLKASVQAVSEQLHVLVGPADGISAAEVALLGPKEDGSIYNLIQTAVVDNYAAVILDLPADPKSEFGLQALMAANTVLMVARPATVDQVWAVSTFRLLTEQLAGRHRIARERIYLVLNGVDPQNDNLSPSEFHHACDEHLRDRNLGAFPPIIAVLPTDSTVRNAQNVGKLPIETPQTSSEYRRAIQVLADTLYPGASKAHPPDHRRVINLGIVKVKV